jgi:hypothetical protein
MDDIQLLQDARIPVLLELLRRTKALVLKYHDIESEIQLRRNRTKNQTYAQGRTGHRASRGPSKVSLLRPSILNHSTLRLADGQLLVGLTAAQELAAHSTNFINFPCARPIANL